MSTYKRTLAAFAAAAITVAAFPVPAGALSTQSERRLGQPERQAGDPQTPPSAQPDTPARVSGVASAAFACSKGSSLYRSDHGPLYTGCMIACVEAHWEFRGRPQPTTEGGARVHRQIRGPVS